MSTRNYTMTIHPALGGLDVSTDPSVLDPNYLTIADNIEYLEAGQRRKRLGTLQYSPSSSSFSGTFNSTGALLISSGTNVRALSDMWVYTSVSSARQRYVAVAGASIFKTNGQGIWEVLTTTSSFGSNTNLQTYITIAGSRAVISDGLSAPLAFNPASTALEIATTGSVWPVFEDSAYHLSRLFYTGLSSDVDRVNYTAASNIFDSTGTDAGGFEVGVGDGDRVVGISKPFYGDIYFFKGPHFGSVYRLTGNSPVSFQINQISVGSPALSHGGIVTTPSDIYWISQFGIHSLQTTVKFGNVESAFLSLPIQKMWRLGTLTRTDLINARGFWDPHASVVGWVVTLSGDTRRKAVLLYNYALSDPSPGGRKFWSILKYPYGVNQITPALVSSNYPSNQYSTGDTIHLVGSDQGLVYMGDYSQWEDDGTAITYTAQTPLLTRFTVTQGSGIVPETQEKSFVGVVTYFNPLGVTSTATCDLTATIDGRAQTKTFSVGLTGDKLG